jgi:hypothetical protein
MESLFLKKSPSFTNKLSRDKQNFSVTYDDIKSPDEIRYFDGTSRNSKYEISSFFLFLWVFFALLDLVPDPADQNQCGSGSSKFFGDTYGTE